jgi:hypothetical protein
MRSCDNLIVVSDMHCGCQLGLCPISGARLDEGGRYLPNGVQKKIAAYWREFWSRWVPRIIGSEPFSVVVNGDALDGVHHNATTQISQNLSDQAALAYELLAPVVEKAKQGFFVIRGTEAHGGKSGVEEEKLARKLGAIPNEHGQYARYELWKRVGGGLVHLLHHIGTTGSSAYEATAVHKELVESFTEAGRWGERPPDMIVRSHRHRYIEDRIASDSWQAIAVVTAGWQAKTPFAWRLAGARLAPPQFGGIIIRPGVEARGDIYARSRVWTIRRGRVE